MRENLEHRLSVEQNKVYQYVNKELKNIVGHVNEKAQEDRYDSPVLQAFLKAGMTKEQLSLPDEDSENLDDLEKRLDRLNICIALFSRFKLTVPQSLAYAILFDDEQENDSKEDVKNKTRRFSRDDQALFQAVTSVIPWLYCGETKTGSYAFRFRNSREAEIYLYRHDCYGDRQIQLLCKIMDIYKKDYQESRCVDIELTNNLQALLRLMGPNSTYPPFNIDGTFEYKEHKSILEKLDKLIEKIKDLIDENQVTPVPDENAGFAAIIVTFTREYYKLNSGETGTPEKNRDRINKMQYALGLAEKSISEIENRLLFCRSDTDRRYLTGQRNSLIVETAQCSRRLAELCENFAEHNNASSNNSENSSIKLSQLYKYKILYRPLLDVINSDPTNGYAYNALFSLFEQEYEKNLHLKKITKLQYLSQIMQVVETCRVLGTEIINRGSKDGDEIESHINKISEYSAHFPITIDTIEYHIAGKPPRSQNEKAIFKLYDEMLEKKDASTIMFACQKELHQLEFNNKLGADDLKRCQRVHDFMTKKDHFECIISNAYATETLIRVCWMLYNGTSLNPTMECQLTRLNIHHWNEINRLGKYYDSLTGEGSHGDKLAPSRKQPIIMLLYALSELQISGLDTGEGYRSALNLLRRIDEGQFLQPRMRTPFMICHEDGTPHIYKGTVAEARGNNGSIQIHGMNRDSTVRFRLYNLGRKTMPGPGDVIAGLELGIGYTSFSAYTKSGREERWNRQ